MVAPADPAASAVTLPPALPPAPNWGAGALARDGLRDALRADLAPFTVDAIRAALGPVAAGALDREQTIPARRALERADLARTPLATFVRLFQFGDTLPAREVAAAFPRTGVDRLVELGLVGHVSSSSSSSSSSSLAAAGDETGDDDVRALVELSPYAAQDERGAFNWWIASDLSEVARGGAVLPAGHVLGVGGASRTLAQFAIRRPVERVLDLGTGCGIQALHAARHAKVVVATDVDERALAFTRFNAALNLGGADGVIETRVGSLLEPVAGERFDLVVSNPPFVITPRGAGLTAYTYRDGGAAGDDLVRDLVQSVPSVLAPGGVAQLLGNWEHRAGEPWQSRVRAWLGEVLPAVDAWVVQREVQDPAEYAELWLRDGGQTPDRDPVGYAAAYRAWLEDLAARNVEGVGFGLVTLRRRRDFAENDDDASPSAGGWIRVEEVTGALAQPIGPSVAATLEGVERWADADAAALLGQRWVVAADVTEERFYRPGAEAPSVILLRAGGGFGRAVRCDTGLAAFVGACDGELTGSQIVAALAGLLGVDAVALAAQLVPQIRGLAIDGLLLPTPP